MNSRLLSSFLMVLGFWWTVITVWWGVADPEMSRQAILRLAHLMPWISWQVPQHATVLNAWWLQLQTLKWWSLPLMCLTLLTAGVGGSLTWLWAWRHNQERLARVRRDGEFRGIRLSLGRIPKPLAPPRREFIIAKDNPVFAGIPQGYLDVLQDCIGIVAANTGYAGEGAAPGSLLPRCNAAVQSALTTAGHPASVANGAALQAIFCVAIELGKATSWIKGDDGGWLCTKPEPRESARILATLSSWWDLPPSERTGLYLAVKFQGRAGDLPEMPKDPLAVTLARHLITARPQAPAVVAKAAAPVVVAPAAEITPSRESTPVGPRDMPEPAPSVAPTAMVDEADPSADPETEVLDIFTRECSFFPFQSHGTSREAVPVGWCIQSRVYFTEQRLANRLYEKLPQHLKDKYPVKAGSARYSPLTGLLIKLFETNGWLVTEQIGIKLKSKEALWTIEAGKGTFQSIMIVDFPPEIASRLPGSSSYPIRVIKPQFQKPGDVSAEDILAAFTRPKAPAKTTL